jgi:23S rRNA pseudouridine2604 synthase
MTESIRLAKHLAELIGCSRREAEQYIEGGWVTVDGVVVEEPGFRLVQQHVALLPGATLDPMEPVTVLLHNPAGQSVDSALQSILPANRIEGDRSGLRFLKRHLNGLNLTEPLEPRASGLLVFTQDWRVARKLIDDRVKIEQEYIVEVSGDLVADGLAKLNHGLSFNRKPLPPAKVSWQNERRLRFALKAPQRGQIAHMCEQVGLKVESIKRIRLGRVPMAGLPQGQWRYLLGYEQF